MRASLDPKATALLRVAAAAAAGSGPVCLEWAAGRALAVGASENEIAGVLPAIAPWPGSAGSCAPRPARRSRSATTSKRR